MIALRIAAVLLGVLFCRAIADGPAASEPAAAALAVPQTGQTPEISWPALQAFLQAPKNQTVVIDFWATWCIPCVEALPDLAKLAAAYKDRPVRIVLVSFDDLEDAPAVTAALKKAGVPFGSYILKPADRAALVHAMHPDWQRVVVPASFVYDPAGKQVDHQLFKTRTLKEWRGVIDGIAAAK